MKYFCDDCKEVFDEEDIELYRAWGTDSLGDYQEWDEERCPHCGSRDIYEDAVQCECCDDYFHPDDVECGICKNCINSVRDDIDEVLEFATACNLENELFDSIFDTVDKVRMVTKALKGEPLDAVSEKTVKEGINTFIENNKDTLITYIKEEVRKLKEQWAKEREARKTAREKVA